jgi:hypothetical protein
MNAPAPSNLVRIRVNAVGGRHIGYVHLPPEHHRFSDILNDGSRFLLMHDAVEGNCRAILKEAVSYAEAIEEPARPPWSGTPGAFRKIGIILSRPRTSLSAEVFVASGLRIMDVLNDDRPFCNLRDAVFQKSVERYGFLALGKRQILSVDF